MSDKHIRNVKDCPACCCGGVYVHKYCGGRMHERLIDDTPEDGYIHNYRCEKCDVTEYHYGYEDSPIEFRGDKC